MEIITPEGPWVFTYSHLSLRISKNKILCGLCVLAVQAFSNCCTVCESQKNKRTGIEKQDIVDNKQQTMSTLTDQIASISLFNGLPSDQIDALAMITAESTYEKGGSIFSEDEQATGFYVVLTGRVKVFKLSSEGREQILHIFGPGEVFGEVPVFAGKKFPASADAMEKSRILFFPRASLISLIEKNPSIALNMLAVLSMRLRNFTSMIDDLSLREVPGRLARHLLYLSEQKQNSHELELNITKGQLASLLGTIPETLSRILTKMTEQGIIESDGRKIRIIERDAVEELAEGIRKL